MVESYPNRKPIPAISSDNKPWYHLSTSSWLLIAGLVLLISDRFVNPRLLDIFFRLFKLLDIRLWSWWYVVAVGLIGIFVCRWGFYVKQWRDFDEVDVDHAKRFIRMTAVMSIVMILAMLIHRSGTHRYFINALYNWFQLGVFSWSAVLAFALPFATMMIVIYYIYDWIFK